MAQSMNMRILDNEEEICRSYEQITAVKVNPQSEDSLEGSIPVFIGSRQGSQTISIDQHDEIAAEIRPQGASAKYIRSKFLSRLGISPPQSSSIVPLSSSSLTTGCIRNRDGSVVYEEYIKADHGKPDRQLFRRDTVFPVKNKRARKSCVAFKSAVTVHPIPSRSDYSDRIKSSLWTPMTELQENTARNCLEFASENWNWRQVAEDADMVLWAGERVHPIHFARECNLQNHFCTVMSAQMSH